MTIRGKAGLAALGLALALASGPAAAARTELRIGISQFPATLNPNTESSVAQRYVLNMAHRPFTAYDADWNLVCLLCTELPSTANGRLVLERRPDGSEGIAATFTIRPGAAWGDGTPVTTRDVLFTWEVGRHPQSGFVNQELYRTDIVDITVQDERTFTLHFRPDLRCKAEAINDFRLLPEHRERAAFEADPAQYRYRSRYQTDPTDPGLYFGPYRVTRVETGAYVVLEANPTWYGLAPHFTRIVVRAIENTAALEANLLSGEIDAIAGELGLTLDQALAFEARHGRRFQVIYQPGLLHEHIDVNLDNPILADRRVRRALLHAIDREALSRQLFAGRQPPAHANVHPMDAFYTDDITVHPYDPERAAALLDEAGWSVMRGGVRHDAEGRPLTLEINTTAGNRTRELVQQVLQAQWRAVGIDVRIANYPPRVLFGEILTRRAFPALAMFAWSSSPDNPPRTILHSDYIPTEANGWAGQNFPGFRHAEADRVLDDLQTVCEGPERQALWTRIQQIYSEELPALPLYFRADAYILPPWLAGLRPTGHQYGSSLWVEQWHATE